MRGKVHKQICPHRLHRDHPRTCGEKLSAACCGRKCLGSPPHMRGKVGHALPGRHAPGITPAHAGKRQLRLSIGSDFWRDHPRTCGEKTDQTGGNTMRYGITPAHAGKSLTALSYAADRQGSPPHMRGKADAVDLNVGDVGITPAHAGKSAARPCSPVQQRGSPPHMRGKARHCD